MERLRDSEIKILRKVLKSKNYVLYERPYELNIVGRRTNNTAPNRFDDWIYIFYKNDKNNWIGYKAPATTDAGTYWLKNPMKSKGTALLKEGQYKDTYNIDFHNGKYLAVTQRLKPVKVYRDYDRNALLDFNNGTIEEGFFGINLHRADSDGTTKYVGEYSAGCQVFANADDFDDFMKLAQRHKDLYGNVFTYTLIDERAYNRRKRLRYVYATSIAIGVIGLGIGIYLLIKKHKK